MTDDQLTVLARRFCAASLPYTTRAEFCATEPGEGRTGSNLLTVGQARDVLRQVIGDDVVFFREDMAAGPGRLLTAEPDSVTLRDTFAGLVMQAAFGSQHLRLVAKEAADLWGVSPEQVVANSAYKQADAMLAARSHKGDAA